MNIVEIIKNNWDKNKFISLSLNKNIKLQIENETSFLNSYYASIPLRTRAYVIINDITEKTLPRCKCGCEKVAAINKTYSDQGFREYSGPDCSRKDKTINKDILKKLEDKEWLYEQRIVQKKAIELIGTELGISPIPVTKWLRIHKIDIMLDARRRNSLATNILNDKAKLEELYGSGMTCEQIAETLSTTKSTVARWLSFYDIETRPSNSYERKINKVSNEEKSLLEFIVGIYSGEIISSNRSILNGKELDIYLPEKNIAIEYNGLYSHYYRPWESSESLIKDSAYHLNKTLQCESEGIQLIHLFSDEWLIKRSIVESILKSKLGINERIYARKCKIDEVDTHTKNIFLNSYHIQGEDKSKIKLCLKYNEEILCVMTFTNSRFNKNYKWELSRFCTKSGYNVIGGFTKLLSHFRKSNIGSIISYADRRYSNGNVYRTNGFDLIHINSPSYYYVDKNCLERHNRMKFQKKYIDAYDCTEYEKARELGFNKIFDCGSYAFGLP